MFDHSHYICTMNSLNDSFGRVIDYLRIGVTDRCNLRCRYCMPEEGIDFSHKKELLSYEEILRLCKIFKSLGIKKIRLTGGEPFVRKDFSDLLKGLSLIFDDIYITTNATHLQNFIPKLKSLGIKGLNISLDSLDKDKFHLITRRNKFDIVMQNILAARQKMIDIKVNVVVMKDVNDMEIINFIAWGMDHDINVRFIEAMPFNEYDGNREIFVPEKDILTIIRNEYLEVDFLPSDTPSSSKKYSIGAYQFGIIPAYTRSLCGTCNRIRMTPKGEMLTCLYSNHGIDLRQMMREAGSTDQGIKEQIIEAVKNKKKSGIEEEAFLSGDAFRSMTKIGG